MKAITTEELKAFNTVRAYALAKTDLPADMKEELIAVLNASSRSDLHLMNQLIDDIFSRLDENRYCLLSTALTIIMN